MIGILPAAGHSTRLHGLPKMLLPLSDGYLLKRHADMMRDAGARVQVMAGWHNRNLLERYAPMPCEVQALVDSQTIVETMLAGKAHDVTLFGMPDTYLGDSEAYSKLVTFVESGSDLAIGCFKIRHDQRGKLGMVAFNGDKYDWNELTEPIVDKDTNSPLEWAWGVMAWRPVFWEYMRPEDPHMGIPVNRAIEAGLRVNAVKMSGQYYDCGTFEEYGRLCADLSLIEAAI